MSSRSSSISDSAHPSRNSTPLDFRSAKNCNDESNGKGKALGSDDMKSENSFDYLPYAQKTTEVDCEKNVKLQNSSQQQHQFLLLNQIYNELRASNCNGINSNLIMANQNKNPDMFKQVDPTGNETCTKTASSFSNDFFQNAVVNFALMNKNNHLSTTFSDLSANLNLISKPNSNGFSSE